MEFHNFSKLHKGDEGIKLDHFIENETAENAARVFLSYINATTTVSASYALAIILGISLVLLVILGLISLASSAVFTGAQSFSEIYLLIFFGQNS
jgi:hypothetical protein